MLMDPTLMTDYHSAIFTTTLEQTETARCVTEEVQARQFRKKIVTEIRPVDTWWDAEEYHQLYLFKNPSGYQCPAHRLHW
ncbi:hypothetical protein D9619_007579 [Psilocybe cf. subviscida]|uniref:peptide-methionine (S)-S-oxide reductase n=1 Tax=Psilocybe cf. subviscida TaxID=2480587 RepID=A0A8H5B1Q2_9AGAR|nr:hypothetical protein D9619_007579 [Psilocybe cf. subviscida]